MADANVYDLSYKRYLGNRRPQHTRFRVIARNQFGSAWKGWMRLKLWLLGSVTTTIVIGSIMLLFRNQIFNVLLARSGARLSVTDALLPLSFYIFLWPAFSVTLFVITSAITRDLKSGAFEFYFARPLRVFDYVAGKIGGSILILGLVIFAPITALALYRLGLSGSIDELVQTLPFLPKAVALAALTTAVMAILPLAAGALVERPGVAPVIWAAWYLVVGSFCNRVLANTLDVPEIGAIDPGASLVAIAFRVFDVESMNLFFKVPPVRWALGSLLVQIALALGIIWMRVRQMAEEGVGAGA